MPKISFLNENISAQAPVGRTVREVAIECGIEIERGLFGSSRAGRLLLRLCKGRGLCGGCKAWVDGATNERTAAEKLRPGLQGSLRLACQAAVAGDLQVRTRPGGPGPLQSNALEVSGPPKREAPTPAHAAAAVTAADTAK